MKAIFGESSCIDSWMQLVRRVSWNFPGLETEENLEEHKQTVLKFMNKLQAVCVKDSETIVGVTLHCIRNENEIFAGYRAAKKLIWENIITVRSKQSPLLFFT